MEVPCLPGKNVDMYMLKYKRKEKMCLIPLLSFNLTVMLSWRPITVHCFLLDYFSEEEDVYLQKLHLKSVENKEAQNKREQLGDIQNFEGNARVHYRLCGIIHHCQSGLYLACALK